MADRSASRGREVLQSTGRGGAGNIRLASRDPSVRRDGEPGPDDYSHARGREVRPPGEGITHAGRGGAGNIRSPSREGRAAELKGIADDAKYVATHKDLDAPVSHGRGGAGNISRSRSRSREPTAPAHTTGRGGYGNVAPGEPVDGHLNKLEEEEAAPYHKEGIHETGRGGYGNITDAPAPGLREESTERAAHHQSGGYASTGRGGLGNIVDE